MIQDRWFEALARLARSAAGDSSVESLLRELCEVATLVLPAVGAGVMRVNDDLLDKHALDLVYTHTETASSERVQHTLGDGPCHEALRTGEMVQIADLESVRDRWPALVHEATASGLRAVVAMPLRSRGRWWGVLDIYRDTPGQWSGEELRAVSVLADAAVAYMVTAHDRDQARAAQAELAHRSLHDDLTGLPNRALLFDRMGHAVSSARRRGTALAVIFLDLDRFKEVNDAYGHSCGDHVLVTVAQRLSGIVRGSDTAARLAGDEFVVVCEDLPRSSPDASQLVGQLTSRLIAEVSRPIRWGPTELAISACIGVGLSTEETNAVELLQVADMAMYVAKQRGRGSVVVHEHQHPGGHRSRASYLARELTDVVEAGQLRLHYQPIFEARSGRIRAVEALVRWQHPQAGLLSAHDFIGLADEVTVSKIGHWVVDAACTQLVAWRRELNGRSPETMFCNVSPREMLDPTFLSSIQAILGRHGLQARDLGLEILEEVFSDPLVLPTLSRCQAAGHPLSVDDFGTGYSSLSRLVELPVHYAKMDRSFIAGLPDDARSRALVNAVIVLARGLELGVIGEGVETSEQRDYLTAAGCQYMQGYHLARPMPAEDIHALLATQPGHA